MKIITGRRGVLRTFALTMATGAIGLASAGAKPATAAVESALTPPGATHLDALKKRLAQAPRRRDFKTAPMILNNPEQWDHEALTEVLSSRAAAECRSSITRGHWRAARAIPLSEDPRSSASRRNRRLPRPDPQAIVEATVRRARPLVLTALPAILAMIPLSRSAFWGRMATTIMGGLFLANLPDSPVPAGPLCLWFRKSLEESGRGEEAASTIQHEGNARPAIPLAEAAE